MTNVVFVHGWGFDARFWQPVAELLTDFSLHYVDMGFRARPAHTPSPVSRPIVVGHSMGFAWALEHLPQPWGGAVSVNGFPRFTRSPNFVSGVPPRMVERMAAKFTSEFAEVTRDFLTRCGVESPQVEDINALPLHKALHWLHTCDQRKTLAELSCPVLALAGTRDMIVPEAMSREAFAAHPLVLVEGGGHLLPHSHPGWVAQQIRQFATEV